MAIPSYARSLVCLTKRLKLSPSPSGQSTPRNLHPSPAYQTTRPHPVGQQLRHQSTTPTSQPPNPHSSAPIIDPQPASQDLQRIRLPRAVQATYLTPLRRKPTHNIPTCDLQLRSYSVRNLELYTDFALRAAYYLHLPARGPIPLPRITERWTVPRSNFVHKKSQENFERITLRRLVQIQDGHAETVAVWLGFLQKYRGDGVGMKANVFEYGGLDVSGELEAEAERIRDRLGENVFDLVGGKDKHMRKEESVERMVMREPFKAAWGAYAPMGGAQSVPSAGRRVEGHTVK